MKITTCGKFPFFFLPDCILIPGSLGSNQMLGYALYSELMDWPFGLARKKFIIKDILVISIKTFLKKFIIIYSI